MSCSNWEGPEVVEAIEYDLSGLFNGSVVVAWRKLVWIRHDEIAFHLLLFAMV